MEPYACTCTAPVNIAVVKYWGKRCEKLVLPLNSSVSVTLSQDQMRAKTTIMASDKFDCDQMWLNGREESISNPRIQNLIQTVKARAKQQGDSDNTGILDWPLHICSENNFPTAAGLASSAAGYACLAFTLAQLYKIKGDISEIARHGSGSACRSVLGGFVVWDKGHLDNGKDSIARQVAMETHWPDLRVLILVVSDHKKPIGSSEGMQVTSQTSELLQERIRRVPDRVAAITAAILDRDFHTFAELTMKDSNQLHAVCLDTYPPISYLTDVSRQIMALIHAYNKFHGQNKVAYTFDAGPNACLYLLKSDVVRVASLVKHYFPSALSDDLFFTGMPLLTENSLEDELLHIMPQQREAIQYVIHTKAGPGPQVCSQEDGALLYKDGSPKTLLQNKRKSDCIS